MGDLEPTVRSRELGFALARAAEAKGLLGRDVAFKLGWSQSKVSNLFRGRRGAHTEDVAALLAICDVQGPKRDELVRLAEETSKPGWWREYGYRMPRELRTLSDHEDAAIGITEFQTGLVPGLLQTEAYTRALLHTMPNVPADEVEERVATRMRRQAIFDRFNPAVFRFFLDEYVLTRTGFGAECGSEQVHHLLRMAVRPYVDIRIVPEAAGIHGGWFPFSLMEFTELNPVIFVEHTDSALFLERKDTVAGYRRILAELDRIALNAGESRAWLARVASAMAAPREDHDDCSPPEPGVAEEFVHELW